MSAPVEGLGTTGPNTIPSLVPGNWNGLPVTLVPLNPTTGLRPATTEKGDALPSQPIQNHSVEQVNPEESASVRLPETIEPPTSVSMSLLDEVATLIKNHRLSKASQALDELLAQSSHYQPPDDLVIKVTVDGSAMAIIPPSEAFNKLSNEKRQQLINDAKTLLNQRLGENPDILTLDDDALAKQLSDLQTAWLQQNQADQSDTGASDTNSNTASDWARHIQVFFDDPIRVGDIEVARSDDTASDQALINL